ncbi:sulfatase [Nocardioides sp.]|uniref:sulfatase n=1 Tax=Nocardioides sp. TaxID=35761 RepID=UPI0027197D59|nr:sulfatase [Nocardioides sp.]MDO9458017.1 sulfatase [Nocardioides sp.]
MATHRDQPGRTARRAVLRGLAAGTVAVAVGSSLADDAIAVNRGRSTRLPARGGAGPQAGPQAGPEAGPVEAVHVEPDPAGRRTKHNVVVVSIDDLGWHELGCYGNTFNETPHIDALAARGVLFTQAYAAAPLCSPTRAALVTGRYPARTGVTDFLRPEDAVSDNHLSTRIPTVPDVLGPLGYTTGLIGKWHLTETYSGDYAGRAGGPLAHGFDDVRLSEEKYIAEGDYFHPYRFMPSVSAVEPGEHLTDRLATEAVDFIGDHADEPFFLHLSNYAVHTDLDPRPDLLAKYAAKPGADDVPHNPELAAMLESVDRQVGAVVDALRERRIADKTLVVVISDNGGQSRPANLPLRGGKGELYEGGIRVPMIATWAGGPQRQARTVDTPVNTVDLLPTALELAGGRPRRRDRFDGISLAPLLLGDDEPLADRVGDAMFWVYPHHIGRTHPHAAIRSGDLKLVKQLRDDTVELYDVSVDEGEKNDLSARRPADTRRLRRLLDGHLREVAVLPPAPSPTSYPVDESPVAWDAADVLPVPTGSFEGQTALEGDRIRVKSGARTSYLLLRSPVAPTSGRVAAVLELGDFADRDPQLGGQQTAFVGLAVDASTYLLLRYRHDLKRVGWDLCVDGEILDAGAEPLTSLDGSVDLSAPGARYGFVLRGSKATAYADQAQGGGWEFLFTVDTGGAFDLSDRALRKRTRYAAAVRVQRGSVTLGPLTAARAR